MRDSVWILIALSAINPIVNALYRSSSDCPSNGNPLGVTLLPHPDDCEKYFECVNGIAYSVTCPNGLHWSKSLSRCAHPKVAKCQIIQERSLEGKYDPNCPLHENSLNPTYLSNNVDCGEFYKCFEGYAYAMSCPDGLHWSVELNRCEYPDVANCQRIEPRALIADGYLNANCPLDDDPNNPTLLAYPGNCGKFYMCSYGRSYILSCPYGLHWDVKSSRCESPFIAGCNAGAETAPPITIVPTKSPTTTRITPPVTEATPSTAGLNPSLPVPVPQCSDPDSDQKFGIPGECKVFLQCFRGLAYRITCRPGREWSVTANDCIDAALAGCSATSGSETTTTTTTRATTQRTTTKRPTSCTEGVEYLSHPTDCTKFIQCDNGNPVEKECSPPLYWSKTTKNCQWTADDCR